MLKELIYKGNYEELENKLHTRKTEISEEVNKAVSEIINNVRENGDDALKEYCAKFDGFHVSRRMISSFLNRKSWMLLLM